MNALYTIQMSRYLTKIREINRKTVHTQSEKEEMRELMDKLIEVAMQARENVYG